jgi:hypothetical protein
MMVRLVYAWLVGIVAFRQRQALISASGKT